MATKRKKILSAGEIAALKEEQQEIDSTLNAVEQQQYGAGARNAVDRGALKRQRQQVDKMIHEGSAGRISGTTKDKLAARAKELEGKFTAGMPTRDEMWAKRGEHPGIVRKQRNWEVRNADPIREWKQIQRQLNPDDPTASNIERLRK